MKVSKNARAAKMQYTIKGVGHGISAISGASIVMNLAVILDVPILVERKVEGKARGLIRYTSIKELIIPKVDIKMQIPTIKVFDGSSTLK